MFYHLEKNSISMLTASDSVVSWIIIWNLKFDDKCGKLNSQSFSPKSYINGKKITYKNTRLCHIKSLCLFNLMWMCNLCGHIGRIRWVYKTKCISIRFARHLVVMNSWNVRILNLIQPQNLFWKRCTSQTINAISIQIHDRTEKKTSEIIGNESCVFLCVIHIINVVPVAKIEWKKWKRNAWLQL